MFWGTNSPVRAIAKCYRMARGHKIIAERPEIDENQGVRTGNVPPARPKKPGKRAGVGIIKR